MIAVGLIIAGAILILGLRFVAALEGAAHDAMYPNDIDKELK